MKKPLTILLGAIVLLALIVRTIQLGTLPNGLHVDELDAGYIGGYILSHGKDLSARSLPLFYDKFGDYRPTGIFYLSGLAVKAFGSSPFSVRLPGAVIGAFTVIPLFFLARFLFGIPGGIAASLILTLIPWHIVLSRATSEGVIGLFFLITGLALLIPAITKHKPGAVTGSIVIAALSYLFYHPFRLLLPFVVMPFIWHPHHSDETKRRTLVMAGLLFAITVILALTGAGSGRFSQVAFYQNPSLKDKSTLLIATEGPQQVFRARFFHNKYVLFTQELVRSYVSYYSPEFLFIKGGLPSRYVIPETGLFFFSLIPLCIFGLLMLLRSKDTWPLNTIGWLLVISPIPAAITYDDTPNTHRALLLLLPIVLLMSAGASYLWKSSIKKPLKYTIVTLLFLLTIVEFVWSAHQYQIHSPTHQPFYRNDSYLTLMNYVHLIRGQYDVIYAPGYEHLSLYYLFFTNDYAFREKPDAKDTVYSAIGNIRFVDTWCPANDKTKLNTQKRILIINDGNCQKPDGFSEIKSFTRTDSTVSFKVYTNE